MKSLNDLTILIPTKDRHKWVYRSLSYYSSANFTGQIILADSSYVINDKKKFSNLNKIFLQKLLIINCPNMTLEQATRKILPMVKTKYFVRIPDDDIILINNLYKGIDFLKQKKSYSAFMGVGLSIKTKNNNPYCKDLIFDEYSSAPPRWSDYNSSSVFQRCKKFILKPYSNHMVTRTNLAVKAYNLVKLLPVYYQNFILGEIIFVLTILEAGKIKFFNFNFLVRHHHLKNLYSNIDYYKFLVTNKEYLDAQIIFKKIIKKIFKNSPENYIINAKDYFLKLNNKRISKEMSVWKANSLTQKSNVMGNIKKILKKISILVKLKKDLNWYYIKFKKKKVIIDDDFLEFIKIVRK
jgi:glycosyltransferase domain-containing protein